MGTIGKKIIPYVELLQAALSSKRDQTDIVHREYVDRHIRGGQGLVPFSYRSRPYLALQQDFYSTVGHAQTTLRSVVESLEKSKIDYFVVPGFTSKRYRIGVTEDAREAVIEALSGLSSEGYYASTSHRRASVCSGSAIPIDWVKKSSVAQADCIRLAYFVMANDGSSYGGFEFGCDVEFWAKGDETTTVDSLPRDSRIALLDGYDLTGALIAPRSNKVGEVVPESDQIWCKIKIGNKKYKTFKVFDKHFVGDVQFPIDVVYTWVDGDDPKWIKKYNKYKTEIGGNKRNNTAARFTSHDELRYSLRSLAMYGGFIRNIYIVTDGQVPEWLDADAAGVKVVSHKEIFGDSTALPTFNSHSIGTQLHHIEGLSEHYLYFNDDVFLAQHTDPNYFFDASGVMKVATSGAQVGVGMPIDGESAPSSAGKNVRRLLEDELDITVTSKLKHAPIPQRKTIAYELEEKFATDVDRTMRSRFRDRVDVAFAGLMHTGYAWMTGRAIYEKGNVEVINISQNSSMDAMTASLRRKVQPQTICLNESVSEEGVDYEEIQQKMHDFMTRRFPFPSPWEKRGALSKLRVFKREGEGIIKGSAIGYSCTDKDKTLVPGMLKSFDFVETVVEYYDNNTSADFRYNESDRHKLLIKTADLSGAQYFWGVGPKRRISKEAIDSIRKSMKYVKRGYTLITNYRFFWGQELDAVRTDGLWGKRKTPAFFLLSDKNRFSKASLHHNWHPRNRRTLYIDCNQYYVGRHNEDILKKKFDFYKSQKRQSAWWKEADISDFISDSIESVPVDENIAGIGKVEKKFKG